MIKVKSGKKAKSRARVSVLKKTTVIVNRRTAVFVTRERAQVNPPAIAPDCRFAWHFSEMASAGQEGF